MYHLSAVITAFVFTNRKRPPCTHDSELRKIMACKTGQNMIHLSRVKGNGAVYQFRLVYASNTGEQHSASTSRGVLFFFLFLVCTNYFRCSSSRITISILLLSSNSGKNCFAFSRNFIPVCCSKYREKSFALMRTHPSFWRPSNSKGSELLAGSCAQTPIAFALLSANL